MSKPADDKKPKSGLFKAPKSGPFAKKASTGSGGGGFGLGGASNAAAEPKDDGLFYPNARKDPSPSANHGFDSFGGGIKNTGPGVGLAKKSDRKSSSNIEEAYSDDGFEEESLQAS